MSEEARRPGRPATLSDEQVQRIRELAAGGEPQVAIAALYGISPTLVSMIVRGLRYPDAPGPITFSYQTGPAQ